MKLSQLNIFKITLLVSCGLILLNCQQINPHNNPTSYIVRGQKYKIMPSARGYKARGVASWYGNKFHNRRTSSGAGYNMHAMTAAHKTLPLASYVKIRNLDNGREALVRVNDRGPFKSNRIIDVSYAAAVKLGMILKGIAHVEISYIG